MGSLQQNRTLRGGSHHPQRTAGLPQYHQPRPRPGLKQPHQHPQIPICRGCTHPPRPSPPNPIPGLSPPPLSRAGPSSAARSLSSAMLPHYAAMPRRPPSLRRRGAQPAGSGSSIPHYNSHNAPRQCRFPFPPSPVPPRSPRLAPPGGRRLGGANRRGGSGAGTRHSAGRARNGVSPARFAHGAFLSP